MRNRLIAAAAAALIAVLPIAAALADDEPKKDLKRDVDGAEWVVEAEFPLTNRVIFIVDISGSMRGDKWEKAFRWVTQQVMSETDEMQFAVIAFDEKSYRWEGIPEPDLPEPVPPEWAALPSAIAGNFAAEWLHERFTGGNTSIGPALTNAFAEKREKISIVIVSDGQFSENLEQVEKLVTALDAKRAEMGFGRPIVLCYGFSTEESDRMARIAELTEGGYKLYRDVREPVSYPPPPSVYFHGWPTPHPPPPPIPIPAPPAPDEDPEDPEPDEPEDPDLPFDG